MDEHESDPTGAFTSGGAAGLTDVRRDARTPSGDAAREETSGVDEAEREVITSGTAATSEAADPQAQADAEGEGDGTPLPE